MQQAILFDLDDTLTDTRKRHHAVMADFLCANGKQPPDFNDYQEKRLAARQSNKEIINTLYPGLSGKFSEFWMNKIEEREYLALDAELADTRLLSGLKETGISMIILSLRANQPNAIEQFAGFSFSKLFDQTYFLPHGVMNPKAAVISSLKERYSVTAMVGDANQDFEAAAQNDIPFIGVQSGWYPLKSPILFNNINSYLNQYLYGI